MTYARFILSIAGAFAAGAVLGVLLAPEKGSVTRSKIAASGKDALGNLNKSITSTVKDLTGSIYGSARTERAAAEKV
jgi:gas vesicle protein